MTEYDDFKPFPIREYLNTPITGIIQAGGHAGQEINQLLQLTENIVIFEPQKDIYARLEENCKNTSIVTVNSALGSSVSFDEIMYKDSWEQQSSSLMKPKLHLLQYPMIIFNDTEHVSVTTIADYFHDKPFSYNMLFMDTQGFELKILKGCGKRLAAIDYVLCEVSLVELYENCPLVEDINNFLFPRGFECVKMDLKWETWGDALYRRKSLS
jgi:hypothetical protein